MNSMVAEGARLWEKGEGQRVRERKIVAIGNFLIKLRMQIKWMSMFGLFIWPSNWLDQGVNNTLW